VARFFLFQAPPSDRPLAERVDKLMAFYSFLKTEYSRILSGGLLASTVELFRTKLDPKQHTDEKILDWIIWKYIKLADDGGLLRRQILYRYPKCHKPRAMGQNRHVRRK
jgi:hypothetical protein